MGFRFTKRIKVLPGITLNVSKSGVSTSIGGRGARVNIGKRGARTTVGVPGTGLSFTQQNAPRPEALPRKTSRSFLLIVAFLAAVCLFMWVSAHLGR